MNNQYLHSSYTESHTIQHVANMGIVSMWVPVLRASKGLGMRLQSSTVVSRKYAPLVHKPLLHF